jgi:M6 family metalloprotease-like protein
LSDVVAHDKDNRSIEEQAFIIAYRNQMTLGAGASRMPRRADENTSPQVPTLGSPRIPIILVNYTDVVFIDEDPVATFQNQFNEKEYSCLHYFQSQSKGKFSPRFDILGPVNLPQTRAFYGANVYRYGQDLDTQLGTMIYDACQGVDGDLDFSDYDNDDDGYVDVVVVLYAGVGEAQAYRYVPESVWPCQWNMQESYDWGCSVIGPFQLDGVTIDRYAVFNELEGNNNYSTSIDGVGTFCHEFGHCLGLPDFYPTNGASYYGMGNWDIMDNGCYLNNAHRPAGYTSYERHFMGWMDLIDPVENTHYTLAPLNADEGTAVKVTNDANPDEYYLIEYRVHTGWDEFLPAEGIMILHVDYDKWAWDNNTPNNVGSHQRMTLIPADNILSNSTNQYDLWPLGEHDCLTNTSTPPAKVYTGGYMNKPITAMAVNDGLASFWYMKRLVGDINDDGEVNIADVNALIDGILSGNKTEVMDVNEDGEINIADVNTLIYLIVRGKVN